MGRINLEMYLPPCMYQAINELMHSAVKEEASSSIRCFVAQAETK